MKDNPYVKWLAFLSSKDTKVAGGKNASLGEMIRALKEQGVEVPDGFATTAEAYWRFLEYNNLTAKIKERITELKQGKKSLENVGRSLRKLFQSAKFPEEISSQIRSFYQELGEKYNVEQVDGHEVDVAVRSSATAEDLPEASFAGQQETFLNIRGEEELLYACRRCYASLFTDRAISYRTEKGFDHLKVALSVGVQKMVRSDKACAGVMFSIDTETGFQDVVVINGSWGLGENVVQGTVTPDEYLVFKPLLNNDNLKPIIDKSLGNKERKMVYAKGGTKTTRNVETEREERDSFALEDREILQLARWACVIENHYSASMDIEWAKDGETGKLFIVQARPETVQSQKLATTLKTYSLKEKGQCILAGLCIGNAIAAGRVCRLKGPEEITSFKDNAILVTEMTDPDWVPIMKRSAGIITDHGGRTCHAAIVSRELGLPAIVGTEKATHVLKNKQEITMSCAEGDQGCVYSGILDFQVQELELNDIPKTKTNIMMNIGSPAAAFRWWRLPCEGIGLARMEFIINNIIKIHPMALVRFQELKDKQDRKKIEELTQGYQDKTEYFVDHLARGIARIAASQYPHAVIVRMSDFKTNEYANLIGGQQFETPENNPMLGFRGASRYYSDRYRDGFALECRAIKRVREKMGLANVIVMIPFCRSLKEAEKVLEVLSDNGLKRGKNGLKVYVMGEIPSNITLAEEFSRNFDGFSIGSNDLTQLMLGVDRDSSELSYLFDEQNEAVKQEILRLIKAAHKAGRKVGICGQAPSDYPEFAAFLVKNGIDSISLNPDSVLEVKKRIARVEEEIR